MKQRRIKDLTPCKECGMLTTPTEYHPYAACLMFKACHDSNTVRDNLDFILNKKIKYKYEPSDWFGKMGYNFGYDKIEMAFRAAREIRE
ncbi:MAG: hypothetical protein WC055_01025 [Melioribacteraceae bacterium]